MKLKHVLAAAAVAVAVISCNTTPKIEWAPAGDRIITVWGENLDPADVLAEYPRPQMVREQWVNLNGPLATLLAASHDRNALFTST